MPCWEARAAWPVAQDALRRTIHALLGVLTARVLEQALARRPKPVPSFGQNRSGALMIIEYAVLFGKLRGAVCCSLLSWLVAACGGGGGGGGSGGTVDTTAPSIAAATPSSGSSGASRIADLRVTLSEASNVWFSGDDYRANPARRPTMSMATQPAMRFLTAPVWTVFG